MIVGEVMAEFVFFLTHGVYRPSVFDKVAPPSGRTDCSRDRVRCVGRAPRRNAPLIPLLISALFILFACLYRMLPHLSFSFTFPYLSLTLPLYFSLRIDSLRFQAGCRKWWLKLAFCLHFWMRSLVALGLVCFSIRSRQTAWLAETSAKWRAVWCVETDVKPQLTHSLNQSINQSITERSK